MIDLKRWNWLWLLPCALLWLMPDAAAAASAQMTGLEKDCVVGLAQETMRRDEVFRKTFDDTVRQVQEQRCPPDLAWMTPTEAFALQPLLPELAKAMLPKLQACFPAGQERLRQVYIVGDFIPVLTDELAQSLPRPLCP